MKSQWGGIAISLLLFSVQTLAADKIQQGRTIKFENIGEEQFQVEEVQVVSASPLSTPESSRLRQQRQQMEMETEEKFIQKLEAARMEDERARREQLFEEELATVDSFDGDSYMDPDPGYEPMDSTNELTTSVIVEDPDPVSPRYYLTLSGGGVNNEANNIPDMSGAGGLALARSLGREFWLEGGFYYSFLQSDRLFLSDEEIDQWAFTLGPKYSFGLSNHWVTPQVGALLGVTRRLYNGGENASNAFDVGVVASVDLALNRSVKLGIEGRFMTNLGYNKDELMDPTQKALEELVSGTGVSPLEEFDYTVFLVNLKVTL